MPRMTGGRAVAAALEAEGIDQIFGIAGTHNCPLYDGVHDHPFFKVVTVRHEQGATLMADGYARASGRIAACFVVPGPGLTNAMTGMGMAHSESAPMLVFGGQNPLPQLDREGGHFHELADSVRVAASVCGYAARATTVGEVPKVIREAVRSMRSARARPAYIELPLDIQSGEADVAIAPPERYARPAGDPEAIAQAAQQLRQARRPFVYAGGGVAAAHASAELTKLAEQLGAPVVTSAYGKGAIDERHRLALGDGWGRFGLYDELLDQADLALIVGARLEIVSDANLGARFPARIVQIDLDARVIGQRRGVDVGIVGDARLVLDALAAQLGDAKAPACWFDTEGFRKRKDATLRAQAGPVAEVVGALRAATPDDTIFVDDLTLVGYWMPVLMPIHRPRTLLHPGTFGTLGYSLPAAIGAKLACPRQPVVSINGDGGFLFTVQELATASALQLDLVVLVFNDQAYGAIRQFQDRVLGGRRIGETLKNPDFVKLGQSFGAKSVRVDAGEVGATVARAQAEGGLWLIEVPFAPGGSAQMVPWMP